MNTSFQQIIESSMLNLQQGATIGFIEILISLGTTLFCSSIIIYTYKKTYQGVLYQHSFAITILMSSLVTTSVIMVISGNLVLSLGMVGALSIVRFRSAIKDPLDIVYIFWAITVGIANGVAYFKVSLTATFVLSLIMFLISKRLTFRSDVYLLIVKHNSDIQDQILNIVESNFEKIQIKNQTVKDNNYETIFEVKGSSNKAMKLLEKIENIDVSLVSYENNA